MWDPQPRLKVLAAGKTATLLSRTLLAFRCPQSTKALKDRRPPRASSLLDCQLVLATAFLRVCVCVRVSFFPRTFRDDGPQQLLLLQLLSLSLGASVN